MAANLLNQNFVCKAPNTVWLADISYLPTNQGFLYFAGIKDLCTKKIVGWSMSATIDAGLVVELCSWRSPASGLLRGLCCIRIVAVRQCRLSREAEAVRHASEHVPTGQLL